MLSLFLKEEYFFIYTHFPGFRLTFSTKVNEIEEMAIHEKLNSTYSSIWLDELISMCIALRNKSIAYGGIFPDKYPYDSTPLLSFA
jgi:hypothetical protein